MYDRFEDYLVEEGLKELIPVHVPNYTYLGDAAVSDSNGTDVVMSGPNKEIEIWGLEAGTYVLVEEEAPAGYNKLAHPIVITITGDENNDGAGDQLHPQAETSSNVKEGYLTYLYSANDGFAAVPVIRHWEANCSSSIYNPNADYGDGNEQILNGGVHIINQTGAELPSTGGWDTKLTYVVGAVLAFASVLCSSSSALYRLRRRSSTARAEMRVRTLFHTFIGLRNSRVEGKQAPMDRGAE